MVEGVFVFADHMSPRPERFNSRFSLLGQSPFLSRPIRSANDTSESLGQLDPQMLFQRVSLVLQLTKFQPKFNGFALCLRSGWELAYLRSARI